MVSAKGFDEELDAQVKERLSVMEDPDYQFPEPLGKVDWAAIVAVPVICLVLLIVGEFL